MAFVSQEAPNIGLRNTFDINHALLHGDANVTVLSNVQTYSSDEHEYVRDWLEQLGQCLVEATDHHVQTCQSQMQKFQYFGRSNQVPADDSISFGGHGVPAIVCPEHIDGGLLTLVVKGGGDGLQMFDQQDNVWVDVDGYRGNRVLVVVFVGHTLEAASGGVFRAARHRVRAAPSDRLSVVHKLRADGSVWLPHAGKSVAELMAAFEAEHATVNPPAGNEQPRASAVGGSVSSRVLRRSIVSDVLPESLAVLRYNNRHDTMHLIGQHADRCALVRNAYFRLWVLQQWSYQYHGDLGEDVRRLISELARPPAPSTLGSVVEAAVRLANRVDEAAHDWDVQGGYAEGNFQPWTAADACFVNEGLRIARNVPPQALAMDMLGITHSIVDVELVMLHPPEVLSAENTELNLKTLSQGGTEIFFKCRMNTQLASLMYAHCHRQGVSRNMLRFYFDGQPFSGSATPFVLGMEDGDVIDVMMDMVGD